MYKWDIQDLKFQIGKVIQLKRLQSGLSQLQLGNELNISSNHVGRIERAETNPTVDSIIKIINFLEIDILILFTKLDTKELKKIELEIDRSQKEFKNKNKRKS
ncbi:helix-turn-helix transcriptional regulator [Chryseobacterium arthrosphaerae]|uniref:helix-turn-helix domain-containing protein n=1 Tax=Chryseobacterium arthrosphaerae TaxID=651561 RepID=UPI0031CEA091